MPFIVDYPGRVGCGPQKKKKKKIVNHFPSFKLAAGGKPNLGFYTLSHARPPSTFNARWVTEPFGQINVS